MSKSFLKSSNLIGLGCQLPQGLYANAYESASLLPDRGEHLRVVVDNVVRVHLGDLA